MMQQQADDLVGREHLAPAVHAANAVGIAIRHQTNIMRMPAKIFLAARVIFVNRFGIDAAKQHIVLRVQRGHLAGRAREQLFETPGADAKQCIVGETQF